MAFGLIATGGAAFARLRDATETFVPRPAAEPTTIAHESERRGHAERSFVGVVLASDTVEIAARRSGRVDAILVRLGSHVARGERIAMLDTRSLQRELVVAQAQVGSLALEVNKRSVELQEVQQRLLRRQAGAKLDVPTVSGEELTTAEFRGQQADLDLKVANARVAEQQARVDLLRQQLEDSEIRAPFDGLVAARYVDPGAVVTAETSIVRLLGTQQVRLRFAVPETVAGRLAAGSHASVQIDGTPGSFDAWIERAAPEVDTAARLVFVEATLQPLPSSVPSALAGRIARVACDEPAAVSGTSDSATARRSEPASAAAVQ